MYLSLSAVCEWNELSHKFGWQLLRLLITLLWFTAKRGTFIVYNHSTVLWCGMIQKTDNFGYFSRKRILYHQHRIDLCALLASFALSTRYTRYDKEGKYRRKKKNREKISLEQYPNDSLKSLLFAASFRRNVIVLSII